MVGEPEVVCGDYQRQFDIPQMVQKAKNGLYCEKSGWYLYKNGMIDKETTLAKNQNGWWYVKDGKIDFSYTGLASNQNGTWYVWNGKIDFKYSGNYKWNGKIYQILDGKLVEDL